MNCFAGSSAGECRDQLLATGGVELIEGNDWGDAFWGVCGGYGQNWLGVLLMLVRSELAYKAAL